MPALAFSLFFLAVGAILAFAVSATVEGIAIQTVGVILMAIGFLGILMAMLFMMSFSPFGRQTTVTTTTHDPVDHVHH
jgi:hypothetical protein